MAGYEEKIQLPPLTFGGLNTRLRDAFAETDFATSIRNADLRPYGAMKKRNGMLVMTDGAERDEPEGVGAGDFVGSLTKQTAGLSYMLAIRNGTPNYNNFAAGGFKRILADFTGDLTYRSATAPFTEQDPYAPEYLGECLYFANGTDEPHIMTGDDEGEFVESVPVSTIPAVSTGSPILVNLSSVPTYREQQGDWVVITGTSGTAGVYVEGLPWRVEWVTTTSFYLCEKDGSRHLSTAILSTGNGGDAEFSQRALLRWPKSNWSTATDEQFTGYPDRWDDPNGDLASTWPAGIVTDFPSGIEYIGEGQSARMFAYGFELDPDRIDYTALGVPWHFGKVSFKDSGGSDAASEGAAVPNPGIDGGFFYCNRGDGDLVVGVREYAGYIIVFKRKKTYIYSGIPGASSFDSLGLVRVINSGAVSDNSIFAYGNELLYWSLDGPRSLGVTDAWGDLLHTAISSDIQDLINEVTQSARGVIHGYWDRVNERVLWMAPVGGNTKPNAAYVLYPATSENELSRWSYWDGRFTETNSVAVFNETLDSIEKIYSINEDGLVYEMNVGFIDDTVSSGYWALEYNALTGSFSTGETVLWNSGTESGTIMIVFHGGTNFMSIDVLVGSPPLNGATLTGSSGATGTAMEDAYLDFDDVPVVLDYISNWRPLGGGIELAKRSLFLTVVFGDGGRGGVGIFHGDDYDDAWTPVNDVVFIKGQSGAYWGTMVWGSFIWGEAGKAMVRYTTTGVSRLRRFRFTDSSVNGCDLVGCSIDLRAKGDRG